jgi:hypothetical protein
MTNGPFTHSKLLHKTIDATRRLFIRAQPAPMVSNWLIEKLKQPLAPVFYIIAYAMFGLVIMWPMAETNAKRLDQ